MRLKSQTIIERFKDKTERKMTMFRTVYQVRELEGGVFGNVLDGRPVKKEGGAWYLLKH